MFNSATLLSKSSSIESNMAEFGRLPATENRLTSGHSRIKIPQIRREASAKLVALMRI